jgi:outer membrane protein assembly factor BamD (BamD/ComL family)
MNRTTTGFSKKMGSLLLIMIISFSFGCSSISEEADQINETENVYSELITKLETMQWDTAAPNARSNQAMPTFKVTITTLQKLMVVQSAVQDKATVLIATDEAYAKLGITPENVEEYLEMLGPIIFNQTISNQTIKGKDLAGNTFSNLLSVIIQFPTTLSFVKSEEGLYVNDSFGNSAKIIRTDWGALKSTSHFIDNVLVPKF